MCWSVDSADTLQSVLLGLGDHWVRPSPSYSYSLLYLVPRHVMMTVKHKPEWWKDTGTCLLQYSSVFQYSSNNSLPDNYCQVVSRSLCLLTLIRVFLILEHLEQQIVPFIIFTTRTIISRELFYVQPQSLNDDTFTQSLQALLSLCLVKRWMCGPNLAAKNKPTKVLLYILRSPGKSFLPLWKKELHERKVFSPLFLFLLLERFQVSKQSLEL